MGWFIFGKILTMLLTLFSLGKLPEYEKNYEVPVLR